MKLESITKQNYVSTVFSFEKIVLYSIYLLSILVPLLIGKPQLLVGSIVNTLIVFSTLTYGIKKSIPVYVLPSITATSVGLLFDGATYFLLFTFPFIIISNFIFAYFVSKKQITYRVLSIASKGVFLLLSFYLMNKLIGLPSILVTSTYLQFVTAAIGVIAGFSLFKYSNK